MNRTAVSLSPINCYSLSNSGFFTNTKQSFPLAAFLHVAHWDRDERKRFHIGQSVLRWHLAVMWMSQKAVSPSETQKRPSGSWTTQVKVDLNWSDIKSSAVKWSFFSSSLVQVNVKNNSTSSSFSTVELKQHFCFYTFFLNEWLVTVTESWKITKVKNLSV